MFRAGYSPSPTPTLQFSKSSTHYPYFIYQSSKGYFPTYPTGGVYLSSKGSQINEALTVTRRQIAKQPIVWSLIKIKKRLQA